MDLALRDHDLFQVEISISNIMILIYFNHHELLWSIGRDVKRQLPEETIFKCCLYRWESLTGKKEGKLELDRRLNHLQAPRFVILRFRDGWDCGEIGYGCGYWSCSVWFWFIPKAEGSYSSHQENVGMLVGTSETVPMNRQIIRFQCYCQHAWLLLFGGQGRCWDLIPVLCMLSTHPVSEPHLQSWELVSSNWGPMALST